MEEVSSFLTLIRSDYPILIIINALWLPKNLSHLIRVTISQKSDSIIGINRRELNTLLALILITIGIKIV